MMDGDTSRLVVSDWSSKARVWIRIKVDFTMEHDHTHQLKYKPCGSYNKGGNLLVSDALNHKIYRYTGDGQPLSMITVPDDVNPRWITRHGDGYQYVVDDVNPRWVTLRDGDQYVVTDQLTGRITR